MKDNEVLNKLTAEELELISNYSRRVKESQEQLQRHRGDDSTVLSGDMGVSEVKSKNPALKLSPVIFNETQRPILESQPESLYEVEHKNERLDREYVQPKRQVLVSTNDESELRDNKASSFHPREGGNPEMYTRGRSYHKQPLNTKKGGQRQPFHTRAKSNTKASLDNSKLFTRPSVTNLSLIHICRCRRRG
eukprot:TRINITY_DN5769_c0_g2_i3.p1 TRINITY_DN5769_c0_g2~~TRINITY_DN5769_c0_g2_i3.p1  ORF type:complete len:192 (-),score=33.06 TRINITY_DN5769_c0_g2_i3:43-618(-)